MAWWFPTLSRLDLQIVVRKCRRFTFRHFCKAFQRRSFQFSSRCSNEAGGEVWIFWKC